MNPEEEVHISKQAHKKVRQQIELLFTDPDFLRDVAATRQKLGKLIRRAVKLADDELENTNALIQLEIKSKIEPDSPKFRPSSQYKKHIRREGVIKDELGKIKSDPKLKKAADELGQKYKLYPPKAWRDSIINFILFDYFIRPNFAHYDLSSLLPESDRKEMLTALALTTLINLRKENFGVIVKKNMKTNQPILYIQIFENTSRDDVAAGWKKIERIQKALFKRPRFYPIKNVADRAKIAHLDVQGIPDWQKPQMIYGDDDSLGWGEREKKHIKDFKRIRSRSPKRFRTKS